MKQDCSNRENILACAQRLFYEKGYDSVGVQEIVDTAGITKPTMYYYFKSKQGLLESLLEQGGKRMLDSLKEAIQIDGSYERILQNVVRSYITTALENKEFYLMLVSLFSSARDHEGYKVAKPYITEMLHVTRGLFERLGKEHKSIQGREDYLAISLNGIITYYMLVSFERGLTEETLLNDTIVQNITSQFIMWK